MNVNGPLYKIITVILGAVMMSFAWPLRGQFGHEWGAAVTGGMAAALLTVLLAYGSWRRVLAQAVFFGTLGFVLGGENIAYGQLIDDILLQPTLAAAFPQLLLVLFIGATWGAIAALYLGYGVSEKAIGLWDYVMIVVVGAALVIISMILGNISTLLEIHQGE